MADVEQRQKLGFKSQWQSNVRAMKDRVKSRLCAAQAHGSLRQSQGSGVVRAPALRGKTGVVVARVFKGNVVFARFAKSVAKKWPWSKDRVLESIRNFRTMLAGVTGGMIAYGGSAHAEARTETSNAQGFLEELAAKRKKLKGYAATTLHGDVMPKLSEDSPAVRVLRAIAIPILGNVCHVFMHGLNRTEVYGLEKLQKAILHRPDGQGLITVSNHVAAMDDPLVTASLLSPQMLLNGRMLRWTLCATDRCFTSAAKSTFFTCLKVLPVSRGQGIHQQGMDMALEKLDHGDWVHIFPEGGRSRDGGKTIANAKRGVGRLVLDANTTPLVVPFVHAGMQDVMPIGSKFPHICKRVTVLVGDPIEVNDLVARCNNGELSSAALYDAIALRVGGRMQMLKQELDQLVLDRNLELENHQKLYLARRGSGIWEHVDWEMEGFSVEDITAEGNKKALESTSRNMLQTEDVPTHSWVGIHDVDNVLGGPMSITARLKSYADPAVFMSFAARGLAFYNDTPRPKVQLRWSGRSLLHRHEFLEA